MRVVIYIMMCLFANLLLDANAQSIRNSSNMLVGKIETNGIVRDKNNMTIGKFESDGDVRYRNNMLVGKIEANGTIRDRNNMIIGKVWFKLGNSESSGGLILE